MGELVVADVVLGPLLIDDNNPTASAKPLTVKQQALKIYKNQLQRFEIPTKITVVENIVYNPSGKLNRN